MRITTAFYWVPPSGFAGPKTGSDPGSAAFEFVRLRDEIAARCPEARGFFISECLGGAGMQKGYFLRQSLRSVFLIGQNTGAYAWTRVPGVRGLYRGTPNHERDRETDDAVSADAAARSS